MATVARKRSWFAFISAGLGVSALLGVLCFHFPELLTSREFRQTYEEGFARQLLLFGLMASFVLGTVAILRGTDRRVAMIGVCTSALAVLGGGATVHFQQIHATPYSLGLDWFVISLFFSTLVFIPIERMLVVRELSPLRPEWRTDLAYYFFSHVLVQFVLIAVTASTSAMDALVASKAVKATVQSWPVLVQFLAAVLLSSRHMDWLAGSRVHLVEVILARSAVLLPLVLMGFSADAVNAYVILVGLQAVLAHANLGINFGWLEYLMVTPRYHHWHHARHLDYMDRNYAIHLPLVDMLMGTFARPPSGTWPDEYGVMKMETVPRGLVPQLAMPFRRRKTFDNFVGGPGEEHA